MAIKGNVFASKAEETNFYKLSRTWGDRFRIYHNLPFLNVIDISDQNFDYSDEQRLKKTSIDYTLCDERNKPIISIEFDGWQNSFNVGTNYNNSKNEWRKLITDLKLKAAHDSEYPFFVVGYEHFSDIEDLKLTIVDGIIGNVLTIIENKISYNKPFDPNEVGITWETYNNLPDYEKGEVVQDYAIAIHCENEFKYNPISNEVMDLVNELTPQKILLDYILDSSENVSLEEGTNEFIKRFLKMENSPLLYHSCTLEHSEIGMIKRIASIPNFKSPNFDGLSLVNELSQLFALNALKKALKFNQKI